MAERGVSFAGDGSKDVGGTMPKDLPGGGLKAGGPISGPPETNKGESTDVPVSPANAMGMPPKGDSQIKFAGDVGK